MIINRKKVKIFLIYFPQDKNKEYSLGKTQFIDENDNNIFEHSCPCEKVSQDVQ